MATRSPAEIRSSIEANRMELALSLELLRIGHHALEGAPGGAHALHGHDLVLQREDRLDLQRAAEPRLRLADAPAATQVLECVHAEPDAQRLARLAHALHDGVPV